MRLGLTVAGGTDAHRVSSYNPFVALQWYLDGTTIGGIQTRGDAEAPSRRQALEMYTRNSAFVANDDDKRGTLEPGKFADLAVLSADYLTAPVKEIGKIRSVLTMVGGKCALYCGGSRHCERSEQSSSREVDLSVIPGRASWREPGIQRRALLWISGSSQTDRCPRTVGDAPA